MGIRESAGALRQFVQGVVGDGLRGVVIYEPGANTMVYVRSDLQELVGIDELAPTIEQARKYQEALYEVSARQPTLGVPQAGVSVFANALVLIFPYDEERGIIVTLERDVGRDLTEFVTQCHEHI